MAIPAYMWLKDDGDADIKGSATVHGREGSIEVIGFSHGLNLPVDGASGKITGPRMHSPMHIEKEFDAASPYLYKAVAKGQTLKSAELRWYRIDDSGRVKRGNFRLHPMGGQGRSLGCITLASHADFQTIRRALLHINTIPAGNSGVKAYGWIEVTTYGNSCP
jgi:Type VI secretion system effector, Hcp/Protein of unknown function (DUF2778)